MSFHRFNYEPFNPFYVAYKNSNNYYHSFSFCDSVRSESKCYNLNVNYFSNICECRI